MVRNLKLTFFGFTQELTLAVGQKSYSAPNVLTTITADIQQQLFNNRLTLCRPMVSQGCTNLHECKCQYYSIRGSDFSDFIVWDYEYRSGIGTYIR